VGDCILKPKAVGWFSSAERWFQTRVSIESYRECHEGGDDTEYYLLFCGSIRDFARISVPHFVKVVYPNQMDAYYLERMIHVGTMGGFPRCLIVEYMLRQGHSAVMAFDGDTEFLGTIDDLWDKLVTHDAIATPHRIKPPPRDGKAMCLEQFAMCGNYNVGLVGFSNTPNARQFVEWWMRESIDNPECNMGAGRFAEQGWFRFVGDYMDRVWICRDQGINFAFWRYDGEGQFRKINERWFVDGTPLRMFHYGALDWNDLGRVAVHHTRCRACPHLLKFFERYRDRVFLTT